jgi:hypothetical protein
MAAKKSAKATMAANVAARLTHAPRPRPHGVLVPLARMICSEVAMPFSVYAAMLSSQLIITVADRVPEFDVGPSCRESSVPDCLNMEKVARDKLTKDWPTFTPQDRANCAMEEKLTGPPSYVGWLTCLEINANARSPEASGADSGAPAAATGGETGPKTHRRIHRRH